MSKTIRLPVKAPLCCTLHGRQPCWEKAHGPDTFFDPKGYLHLPYGGGDFFGEPAAVSTRVFFDRSDYRAELYRKRIKDYRLENAGGTWEWVVTVA